MHVIRISDQNISEAVAAAAGAIRKGGIVAFPTETYYGLGAAYHDVAALRKLFALKRRPEEKPIPLITGNEKALGLVALPLDDRSADIIRRFWPGPLTLILPAKAGLPHLLTAGTGNVAVRMPGKSFALELARALEFPFTATSANISGSSPADDAAGVAAYFGEELDLIIDGGRTPGGAPSTIISLSGERITLVRQGLIPFDEILAIADRENR
jgi:L-threonylcarbamoyladenylate synthase